MLFFPPLSLCCTGTIRPAHIYDIPMQRVAWNPQGCQDTRSMGLLKISHSLRPSLTSRLSRPLAAAALARPGAGDERHAAGQRWFSGLSALSAFPWHPRVAPLVALRNCQIISTRPGTVAVFPLRVPTQNINSWNILLGQPPVQNQLHVSGTLKLFKDHIVHPAPLFPPGRSQNGQAAAFLQVAGSSKNRLACAGLPGPHPRTGCGRWVEPPGCGPWPGG